jgi:hypothetical protein
MTRRLLDRKSANTCRRTCPVLRHVCDYGDRLPIVAVIGAIISAVSIVSAGIIIVAPVIMPVTIITPIAVTITVAMPVTVAVAVITNR